jgi:SAM-dependent methyltransferase
MVRRGGIAYGPHFISLETLRTSTTSQRVATTAVRNNWHGDEANYHLHPVILDSYLQLLGCAAMYGLTNESRQAVPTMVESLTIFRCSSNILSVSTSAKIMGDKIVGEGGCIADSQVVLRISGACLSPFDDPRGGSELTIPTTARCEWIRHIDFEDYATLIKPYEDHKLYGHTLDELTKLTIELSKRLASRVESTVPEMQKYKAWLYQQVDSSLESIDELVLRSRIDSLSRSLAESPTANVANAIVRICNNIGQLMSGDKKAFEVLNTDNTMNKIREFMNKYDGSEFFQCLAHSKPNLRVLELGAGTGAATAGILQNLKRVDGQVLYSEYVVSDASSGNTDATRDRFKGFLNLDFATLDICRDLADQGFEDQKFDLIIATNVIHATPRIQDSLRNARKLLSKNGRLIMQEVRPGLCWTKYILGTLPGWWCGTEDDRAHEPYISLKRWEENLQAAGFQGLNISVAESSGFFDVLVSSPRQNSTLAKRATLLMCSADVTEPTQLAQELIARGYDISYCTMEERLPEGGDVIVLLDKEDSYFDRLDSVSFERFQKLVKNIGTSNSGILWITRPSQINCEDPTFAPVIGLARTIRSEMAIDFATCEVDDLDSSLGCKAVATIFIKFNERKEDRDSILGPDFEYAICNGTIRVSRFFPFALNDELQVSESSNEAILTIARPGRLDTMCWLGHRVLPPQGDEVEVEVYVTGLNFRVGRLSMY